LTADELYWNNEYFGILLIKLKQKPEDEKDNVKKCLKAENEERIISQLNQKDFLVQFVPSSYWNSFNQQSV